MSKVIAPFLFLAIAAGLFFSYTKPAYEALTELTAQDLRLDAIWNQAQDLQVNRKKLWDKYTKYDDGDMMRVEKLLPDVVDPVRFIIDVDDIAEKNNITITGFTVPTLSQVPSRKQVEESSEVRIATFTVQCEGLYEDIKEMLSHMETSLALMDIINLQVKAPTGDDEEDPEKQEFTISFSTYWLN